MNAGITAINEEVERASAFVQPLLGEMGKVVVGQKMLVERLIIGLLANGHVLLEGVPGLAKTLSIKSLANCMDAQFARLQFTPDMLPADVVGTQIYNPQSGGFTTRQGPVFANLVLADEINRAPAKVQAALLEAMEERQVTVAGTTHLMEPLFTVMATQNPIEQEGTYPLPEAQMDRFLMHVNITYPPVEDEVEVIRLVRGEEIAALEGRKGNKPKKEKPPAISQEAVFAARAEIGQIHVSAEMDRYMADLVQATRMPGAVSDDLARWIEIGSSPRASLALDKCSRAHAWLHRRDYVDPQDLRAVVHNVLRHRLTLSFEAQGDGKQPDDVVDEIVKLVALP